MGKIKTPQAHAFLAEIGRHVDLNQVTLFHCRLFPESGDWVLKGTAPALPGKQPIFVVEERARVFGLSIEIFPDSGEIAIKGHPSDLLSLMGSLGEQSARASAAAG